MFKIGEFARLNRVTIQALRYYDRLGLLEPIKIDEDNGYRNYSASQMPKLNKIIVLKNMGLTLKEIKDIFDKNLNDWQIKEIIMTKQNQIIIEIDNSKAMLSRIESYLKNTEVECMKYNVIVKETEAYNVATLRDYITENSDQGHLWEELVEHINKYNVKILSPCMVLFHNSEKHSMVDAEVVEVIDGQLPATERIQVKVLKRTLVASVIHEGPYENLNIAYSAISKWIEDNNYVLSGSLRELYIKGEWNSEGPHEYITEIQFPIVKN